MSSHSHLFLLFHVVYPLCYWLLPISSLLLLHIYIYILIYICFSCARFVAESASTQEPGRLEKPFRVTQCSRPGLVGAGAVCVCVFVRACVCERESECMLVWAHECV